MFDKKKKELTEEQIDILVAIKDLVHLGKIPFAALEPIYKDFVWSKRIEDYIKELKEGEQKLDLDMKKSAVEGCMNEVEIAAQKLAKANDDIAAMKAELEEQKSREGCARNENRIRNLLWWIFNNEESAKQIEDELREKQDRLKMAEKGVLLQERKSLIIDTSYYKNLEELLDPKRQ